MEHEPECGSGTCSCNCVCDALREAYQRGREDAAFAVATILNGIITDDGVMIYAWQAIKQARGKS